MAALVQFVISESYFTAATLPESLIDSQSNCLMEVALATVSFMLPAMEKELGT
jgi:hypothetical protein